MSFIGTVFGGLGFVLLLRSIRVMKEWEKGVVFRLGSYNRTLDKGMRFVIPMLENNRVVDMRTAQVDLREQSVITKDNVSMEVDAFVLYRVRDPVKAMIKVEDYKVLVEKFGQTALRSVAGGLELDELLEKRETVASRVNEIMDKEVTEYGLDIVSVELQDVILPKDMKRVMARQSEAEREKRGVIIAAEGELQAANNLSEASKVLEESEYGFALRQLQTISDVSQDQSNTIIFFPTEGFDKEFLSGMAAKVPVPEGGRKVKMD